MNERFKTRKNSGRPSISSPFDDKWERASVWFLICTLLCALSTSCDTAYGRARTDQKLPDHDAMCLPASMLCHQQRTHGYDRTEEYGPRNRAPRSLEAEWSI